MIRIKTAFLAFLCSTGVAHADMTLSFDWGDIPLCTSGNPNRVGNPTFVLRGVPEGTTRLVFEMQDLDVPNYDHGGGTVRVQMGESGVIPEGTFRYKSPCPPNGSHTYQWTVTAQAGSRTLESAQARRPYPE